MSKIKFSIAMLMVTALTACASMVAPTYVAPKPNSQTDYYRVVPVPFEEAWSAMIDYVATTSFSIKAFEKASGLLSLSFGASDIPRYVDCGTWDGYPYIQRDLGFRLNGSMNIRIKDMGNGTTSVRVSTNYVLRDNAGTVYNFRENAADTVEPRDRAAGSAPTRTCQSTQAAERQVITQIDGLSSR